MEVAELAGGARALAGRAEALAAAGDLRLAAQLVELAAPAAPDDGTVHGVRAAVYRERVAVEASVMAQGVFAWAAAESEGRIGGADADRSEPDDG